MADLKPIKFDLAGSNFDRFVDDLRDHLDEEDADVAGEFEEKVPELMDDLYKLSRTYEKCAGGDHAGFDKYRMERQKFQEKWDL